MVKVEDKIGLKINVEEFKRLLEEFDTFFKGLDSKDERYIYQFRRGLNLIYKHLVDKGILGGYDVRYLNVLSERKTVYDNIYSFLDEGKTEDGKDVLLYVEYLADLSDTIYSMELYYKVNNDVINYKYNLKSGRKEKLKGKYNGVKLKEVSKEFNKKIDKHRKEKELFIKNENKNK